MSQGTLPRLVAPALTAEAEPRLRELARVSLPWLGSLEKQAVRRWLRLGLGPRERKALRAVTAPAAFRMLAGGASLADFFEQVEYSGRRLAKLELALSQVGEELERVSRGLEARWRRSDPGRAAEWIALGRQLQLAATLALQQAYYQVREAEAEMLHALFGAELAAHTFEDLVGRCLEIVARWAQAAAARLYWRETLSNRWSSPGSWPTPLDAPEVSLPAARLRRLSRPRYLLCRSRAADLVLDPQWRRRYVCCWSIPWLQGGRVCAVLQLAFSKLYEWLPREQRLLAVAGERLLEAAEKMRLSEALARREQQLRRLAEHMVHIEERERQRVSQELHDEAGQSLLCLRLQLEMLEGRVPSSALRTELAEARALAERTVEDLRRVVADLSPSVLEHLGLAAAVRRLVVRLRRVSSIRPTVRMRLERRAPKRLERVAYRLIQECLNNVVRHSQARRLNLFLGSDDKGLRIRVEDDGVGFQVAPTLARARGFGLAGIRERVALLGGRLEIRSSPGQGTRIRIELPVSESEAPRGVLLRDALAEPEPVENPHAQDPHSLG